MELKYLIAPLNIEKISETKASNGQKYGVIEGWASTFGNIDRGGDRILPGAFKNTLEKHLSKKRQIRMLDQHYDLIGGFPIFEENDKGLKVNGNINLEVQKGMEAYSLAKQGVLTDMSIGYRAIDVDYVTEKIGEKDGNEITATIRNIKTLELFEVSMVSFPMNEKAVITDVKSITDISRLLKSKGLSNREANEIIYYVKSLTRNEDEEIIKPRNEEIDDKLIKKIDNLKTISELDTIIRNLKRSA